MGMNHSDRRLMIGTFSYNEGTNLPRMVTSLLRQTATYARQIIVFDESDDGVTPTLLEPIIRRESSVTLLHSTARHGKVSNENLLAERFLRSDCDLMLHFDSDLDLEDTCVERMVDALLSGFEMVSALSLSYPGRNLFERTVRTLNRPYEMLRERGKYPFPMVGHSGGYSRAAVSRLFPFPDGGSNEEVFAFCRARESGLRFGIVPEAVLHFRQVMSINEFMRYRRRVAGREATLARRSRMPVDPTIKEMYAAPPPDLLGRAVLEDPLSVLLAPFVLTVRKAASLSRDIQPQTHWTTLQSTKVGE